MKKVIATVLLAIVVCGSMQAQDTLYTKDGGVLPVKLLEVGPNTISYKRTSNPDGPTFKVEKSTLKGINYADGQKEQYTTTSEYVPFF